MHFGITYDLKDDYIKKGYTSEEIAEFDTEDTIIAIETELKKLGHTTERIGCLTSLVEKLNAGKRWDIVFNICEGMYGYSREAQVPALLDAYKIPYVFSDALVMAVTLHKGKTKRIVRDMGVNTPCFIEVYDVKDIEGHTLQFPLFCKPIAEGTSKGVLEISKVNNQKELKATCAKLIKMYPNQAILVEEYLPGREFTVGITGTNGKAKALGVLEVVISKDVDYTYDMKQEFEDYVKYVKLEDKALAKQCMDLAIKAWRGLGCRDGGRVDIRMDRFGKPSFMEVNPLAGINPIISDLPLLCYAHGITYSQLFKQIITSALERVK
ncbi:MAG: ATP-grasp domain-containing protein [Firmicutes bacterium]|nr:ATP-grasp domain-containing protein [Bacillota bacterium]MCL2771420.1 ATP-grasp domain-containing protein [Bacillota bacterium]